MPDIRDVLDQAAPPVSEFAADDVRRRARRRRAVPRAVMAMAAAAVVAFTLVLVTRDRDQGGRVVSTPPTMVPTTALPTTTLPAYVDPSPSHPALTAAAPRCSASDLRLFQAQHDIYNYTPSLTIFLAADVAEPCALLSYPTLEGLTADGHWESIPVFYNPSEAISSVVWQGVVDPAMNDNGAVPIVPRIESIQPSWFIDGRCPGEPVIPRHYTSLRLVLRDNGGVVELPGAELDTSGSATVLYRFGYDHLGPG